MSTSGAIAPEFLLVWPNWLLDALPELRLTLDGITASYERIRKGTMDDYVCEHVSQEQFNQFTDALMAMGYLDKKGQIRRAVSAPPGWEFAALNQCSSPFRILGILSAQKRMACVQLMDASCRGFADGSLLVGLLCLRSILEQIAHFESVVDKLRSYTSIPSTFEEANKLLFEIDGKLVTEFYATRVEWEGAARVSPEDKMDRKTVEYKPQENRQNRKADSVLNAIDLLASRINETRVVYDILSEFAHPNVGVYLGLTRSAGLRTDAQGTNWIQKTISLKPPIAFVTECKSPLTRVFLTIAGCLIYFEELLVEAQQVRERVLNIAQQVVRYFLRSRKDVVIPYSPCPCGSGAKVKFCCGRRS